MVPTDSETARRIPRTDHRRIPHVLTAVPQLLHCTESALPDEYDLNRGACFSLSISTKPPKMAGHRNRSSTNIPATKMDMGYGNGRRFTIEIVTVECWGCICSCRQGEWETRKAEYICQIKKQLSKLAPRFPTCVKQRQVGYFRVVSDRLGLDEHSSRVAFVTTGPVLDQLLNIFDITVKQLNGG
jgi:hypothetical protein